MAASANKHTHTLLQCSYASVGLAQARPNNIYILHFTLVSIVTGGYCFQCTNRKL